MDFDRINNKRKQLGWKWWILLALIPFVLIFHYTKKFVNWLHFTATSYLVKKFKQADKFLTKKLNAFIEDES